MEMKVAANAPAVVVEAVAARWFAIVLAVATAAELIVSVIVSAEGVSVKWLLYCHAAAVM
jgi:hypothetical protein